MTAHEPWRIGQHVPHHIYRGDGPTVADEVAVTHDPEDARRIVAEHNDRPRLEARVQGAVAELHAALAAAQRIRDAHHKAICSCLLCPGIEPVLVRALQQLQGPADAPREAEHPAAC